MGEVSERSEDGEGKLDCKALSVTFGDSSPGGGAKGAAYVGMRNGAGNSLPLPVGEVSERSEDGEGKPECNTLSVTFGDSSPRDANQ